MPRIRTYEDVLSLKNGSRVTLDATNNAWLNKIQLEDWPSLTYYQFEVSKDPSKDVTFQNLEFCLKSRTHTLPEIHVKASELMDGNWLNE